MTLRTGLERLASNPLLVSMREAGSIGLQGIRAYKMRAFLTILGVVMGIMTVTGMSAIVAGLNASMARQIENLGSSVVFIRPFAPAENVSVEERRRRRPLTRDEVDVIKKLPLVADVSALQLVQASLGGLQESAGTITITGTAESNNRVSSLMRKLESSEWFSGPNLRGVKANPGFGEQANDLDMTVQVTMPGKTAEEGQGE